MNYHSLAVLDFLYTPYTGTRWESYLLGKTLNFVTKLMHQLFVGKHVNMSPFFGSVRMCLQNYM